MAHLVVNLGRVDLNFDYSTVCLILPGLMGVGQKWLGSWARWWNSQIQVNWTQVRDQMGHPVRLGKGEFFHVIDKIYNISWARPSSILPLHCRVYNPLSSPIQVQLLQAIDHPCVIRLEDVIEAGNGMLYIILELAEARRNNYSNFYLQSIMF